MDNTALLAKIELWLQKASNHRYAAHLPIQTFFKKGIAKKIAGNNGQFRILNNFEQIAIFFQRLPQTKIVVNEYYTQKLLFKIIEFYDNSCLLVYPLVQRDSSKLTFEISDNSSVSASSTIEHNSDKSFDILINQPSIVWISSGRQEDGLDSLYGILNETLEHEYLIHPLSRLKSSSIDILREVDQAWNDITYIKNYQEIDLSALISGRIEDLIWLQEIYIHFGWSSELTKFYDSLQQYYKETITKIPPIIDKCKKRLLAVGNKKNNIGSLKQPTSNFLEQYLNDQVDLIKIQEFWNYNHFPLFSVFLENEIKKDADKFIAFVFLAQKYNFIWADDVFKILLDNVNPQTGILLKLLYLLKTHSNLHVIGNQITYQTNHAKDTVAEFSSAENEVKVATILSHKQKRTSFVIKGLIGLKINKPVIIKYIPEVKQLDMSPFLFQPLADVPELQKCRIGIGDYQLITPLCWDQFEITFNRVRVKFLRKKTRFQLSFKFDGADCPITINSDIQIKTSPKYKKIYLPIIRQESVVNVLLVNKFGANNNFNEGLSLIGWSTDSFGILSDKVQVLRQGLQKSYNFEINSNNFSEGHSIPPSKKMEISCPGCKKQIIDIPDNNFIDSLLSMPVELFKNKAVFFAEKGNTFTISQMIFKSIGYFPIIRDIEKVTVNPKEYAIIVSPIYKSERVGIKEKYKTIYIHEKWKIKSLLIHPNAIKRVLEAHFQSK